jgi:hypothetical protein
MGGKWRALIVKKTVESEQSVRTSNESAERTTWTIQRVAGEPQHVMPDAVDLDRDSGPANLIAAQYSALCMKCRLVSPPASSQGSGLLLRR